MGIATARNIVSDLPPLHAELLSCAASRFQESPVRRIPLLPLAFIVLATACGDTRPLGASPRGEPPRTTRSSSFGPH